jgi:cytochrome c-type biogenesis protein CcmH/NrfG
LASVPTYVEATLKLASLRRSAGRAAETIDLLVGILQHDQENVEALTSLAESLLRCGRVADARAAFAMVLRIQPTHEASRYAELLFEPLAWEVDAQGRLSALGAA